MRACWLVELAGQECMAPSFGLHFRRPLFFAAAAATAWLTTLWPRPGPSRPPPLRPSPPRPPAGAPRCCCWAAAATTPPRRRSRGRAWWRRCWAGRCPTTSPQSARTWSALAPPTPSPLVRPARLASPCLASLPPVPVRQQACLTAARPPCGMQSNCLSAHPPIHPPTHPAVARRMLPADTNDRGEVLQRCRSLVAQLRAALERQADSRASGGGGGSGATKRSRAEEPAAGAALPVAAGAQAAPAPTEP